MTTTTKHATKKTNRYKFPWDKWLKETKPTKPATIVFGKDVPASKKPAVLVAQLHQWAEEFKVWAYTSVAHDKKTIQVYGVPQAEGKERPDSVFPSPKKGIAVAKKKAAPKKAKPAKSSKKKASKKVGAAT